MRRQSLALLGALGIAAMLPACGGDDSGSSAASAAAAAGASTAAPTGRRPRPQPPRRPRRTSGRRPPRWRSGRRSGRSSGPVVKRIKDNGWGTSADGKTLTGPEGFTIDLSKCPAGWSNTEGLTDTEIKIGYAAAAVGHAAPTRPPGQGRGRAVQALRRQRRRSRTRPARPARSSSSPGTTATTRPARSRWSTS